MSARLAKTYDVRAGLAEVEGFTVTGVSCITTNENGQAAEDINDLWERFFAGQVGQAVQNKVNDVIYAVYSDYKGNHTAPFRVTIGYKTLRSDTGKSGASDSLHTVEVEPARYGILSAAGAQPKALFEAWEAIWSSDLERAYGTDFEVYGPRFFEEGVHEVLIHVGLKDEQD